MNFSTESSFFHSKDSSENETDGYLTGQSVENTAVVGRFHIFSSKFFNIC